MSPCKPQTSPFLCARRAPVPVWGHPPRNSLRSNPRLNIWDLISTEASSFFFFFPFSFLPSFKAAKSCDSIGINLPN